MLLRDERESSDFLCLIRDIGPEKWSSDWPREGGCPW